VYSPNPSLSINSGNCSLLFNSSIFTPNYYSFIISCAASMDVPLYYCAGNASALHVFKDFNPHMPLTWPVWPGQAVVALCLCLLFSQRLDHPSIHCTMFGRQPRRWRAPLHFLKASTDPLGWQLRPAHLQSHQLFDPIWI